MKRKAKGRFRLVKIAHFPCLARVSIRFGTQDAETAVPVCRGKESWARMRFLCDSRLCPVAQCNGDVSPISERNPCWRGSDLLHEEESDKCHPEGESEAVSEGLKGSQFLFLPLQDGSNV